MDDQQRLLRVDAIKTRMGIGRSKIYSSVKDGTLPEPIHIGSRVSVWPSGEIDAIIAARVAGRSDADIRALVAALHRRRAGMAEGA